MVVDLAAFKEAVAEGIPQWNNWRRRNYEVSVNLQNADLRDTNLSDIDLGLCDLSGADLRGAKLHRSSLLNTKFVGSDLRGTEFHNGVLTGANFTEAKLQDAGFNGADLYRARFMRANLSGADLIVAQLIHTDLTEAILDGCSVWGAAVWDLHGTPASQQSIVISPMNEPAITVDSLELAQFVRLILTSRKLRDVITTVTSKAVLVLGRFTPERKLVLDAMADKLRDVGYLPIIFDWEEPPSRNLTETVSTLAHLSRFVVADITEARSTPQEIQRIVPNLPSVPIVPVLQGMSREYGMFDDFRDYQNVLELVTYNDHYDLISAFSQNVVTPAEQRADAIIEARYRRNTE